MTTVALPGSVPGIKGRAQIERHRVTPEGIKWLERNGYTAGGKKQTIETLRQLESMGMAKRTFRQFTHNLILNNGLTYIRDCIRSVQGAAGVPANVVNGMVLGTSATAAAGTQNGILALITGSYNAFQSTPAAGTNANQVDWVGYWGTTDPASGPHAVEEVAIVPSEASATTQGIGRITSGLSLTKQDQDTLTITITWTIGTLA